MAQNSDPSGWQKFVVYSYSAAVVAIGWGLLGISYSDVKAYLRDSSVAAAADKIGEYRRGKSLRDRTLDTPSRTVVGTSDTPQDALTNEDRRELDQLLGNLQ